MNKNQILVLCEETDVETVREELAKSSDYFFDFSCYNEEKITLDYSLIILSLTNDEKINNKCLEKIVLLSIPFIALSPANDYALQKKAFDSGAKTVINKPIDFKILLLHINKALEDALYENIRKTYEESFEFQNQVLSKLPIGLAIIEYKFKTLNLIYCTDKVYTIFGYEKGELEDALRRNDVIDFRPGKNYSKTFSLSNDSEFNTLIFKAKRKNNEIFLLKCVFQKVHKNSGRLMLYASVSDYTEEYNQNTDLNTIVDYLPGGIIKYSMLDNYKISFISDSMLSMMGFNKNEFEEKFHNSFSQVVYEEDRDTFFKELEYEYKNNIEKACIYRVVCKNGKLKWIYSIRHFIKNIDGTTTVYAIAIDYDENKALQEELIYESNRTKELINNASNGLLTYIINDSDDVEIEYISKGVSKISNYSLDELYSSFRKNCYFGIHPDDVKRLEDNNKIAIKEKKDSRDIYRFLTKDNETLWLDIEFNQVLSLDSKRRFYCSFSDITEIKKLLNQLQVEKEKLNSILYNARISVWYYDIKTHLGRWIYRRENTFTSDILYETPILNKENVKKHVCEESIEDFNALFREIEEGRPQSEKTLQLINPNGTKIWEKIIHLTEYRDQEPIGALGYAIDVTDQINQMNSYMSELSYLENLRSDDIIDKGRINISLDTIEKYDFFVGEAICKSGDKYSDAIEDLIKFTALDTQKEGLRNFLAPSNLFESFTNGKYELSFQYQRIVDKDSLPIWAEFKIKLFEDPNNRDLNAFMYSFDIDEEKQLSLIINKLVNDNFGTIASLDIRTRKAHIFQASKLAILLTSDMDIDYDYEIARAINDKFIDSEKEEALNVLSLKNIMKSLEEKDSVSYSFSLYIDKKLYRNKFEFLYVDEAKTKIIFSRSDITPIYLQNLSQQERINDALTEARKASKAKSEFLSNMSHDIRTPMNAIINMTNMAIDDYRGIGNGEVIEDLDKIKTASVFLLGLINDILDISRIDNNRLELHREVYEYSEFLNYIICIFEPLCQKKNITFLWDNDAPNLKLYVDKVRFNQVFFNVLSNAIKYTDEGGIVEYSIKHKWLKDGTLQCDFTIKDSGCGMSEEFQQKMFEPFERASNTKNIEIGTGLGLTIVKKIVDAVGGKIKVESAINVGTTMYISMPIPIATKEQIEEYEDSRKQEKAKITLQGIRVLVAEDNDLNMIITKRILEDKNMIVTEAKDGMQALNIFDNNPEGSFDIILMDIRMPIMNGLEASKLIRRLDKKDSKTIPIIAMTADAFSEDKKESFLAGMNEHLSKPINKDMLYETIQKYVKNKKTL